ncbi:hypothetical protein Fmac_000779 [Flemingia macrophylla]|uniref:Uncharacterized protein n=1 Tax=Flemingia macrophylla TaxID=520843 RepID=A0ABD1NF88_9FABA
MVGNDDESCREVQVAATRKAMEEREFGRQWRRKREEAGEMVGSKGEIGEERKMVLLKLVDQLKYSDMNNGHLPIDGSSNFNNVVSGTSNLRVSSPDQLWDGDHDEADPLDTVGPSQDEKTGFTFYEANSIRASTMRVSCCDLSSDGKLLASGGHDKKAVLWYTDSLTQKTTLEGHSSLITDVCFSPSMDHLATSSYDKTIRIWDVENPVYPYRMFTGHSAAVMTVDFHPNMNDLVCSCDGDGEIRYWIINSCARVFRGGNTQVRFQPRLGRYLAAAAENIVSIFDVETQACLYFLREHTKPVYCVCWDPSGEFLASGHTKTVDCVCWDPSGEFLASVSEDSVRVWSLGSGSEGECVHELSCDRRKFHACVFHPTYPSLLSLELWNMNENKIMALPAHDGLITALAVSTVNGLIASASHENFVKLWK